MGSDIRRKPVILFDLGDTLIYFNESDRAEVFSRAHQALLESLQRSGVEVGDDFIHDFTQRMDDYYRERDTEFIEYTSYYVLCTALGEWGLGATPDHILRQALEAFHRVTQTHWIPEEDALPTLGRLQAMQYRMGLISNAADDANTQFLVDKAGIRPYMEVIISSAVHGLRKPNPKIFHFALGKMGVGPQQAVMVGDTLGADILGARNAGIYSIWISRRGDTAANRAHQDTIIPDAQIVELSELPDFMLRLEQE